MRVPSVTREGFGYDPVRGELWFAGETAEAVLLELEARRRELAAEASDLETACGCRRAGGGRGGGAGAGGRSCVRRSPDELAAADDRP